MVKMEICNFEVSSASMTWGDSSLLHLLSFAKECQYYKQQKSHFPCKGKHAQRSTFTCIMNSSLPSIFTVYKINI